MPEYTYSEILTVAHAMPKPKKVDVWNLVRELVQSERLTPQEAETLVAFFLPAATKAPKHAWQWVALAATSPKDVRQYMRHLYARDGRLYATDGYRVHWCPTDLPEGYYSASTCEPIGETATYPDVARVIPERKGTYVNPASWPAIERDDNNHAVRLPHDGHLSVKFARDATMERNGRGYVEATLRGENDAVRFDFEDGSGAVVMPIRM